ncbi:N-acetylmuramoyl-L-alanine amidase [Pullulanibacillus pueri]|uniref:MurNAc-LAA domain-containing protein n=1 Tax=Pullulanibacillus pueri TaxID=1437324 RepID=A0A8J2ZT70_9BACL|nr:N-acetylmuramoyl-L-alanine amidase [Pullulanibacillus pueri]MBM7683612.1 N-acetylmuramoyl-L-alanine amidase [Pullulanibacillus pueri]GGH76548.1 hypothetical protein GCM10007096_07140 [Pullulanibacillus pueri]
MKFGKLVVVGVIFLLCFSYIPLSASASTNVLGDSRNAVNNVKILAAEDNGKVNIHKEASVESDVLVSVPSKTKVLVLQQGSNYTQVSYSNEELGEQWVGFVANSLLKDEKQEQADDATKENEQEAQKSSKQPSNASADIEAKEVEEPSTDSQSKSTEKQTVSDNKNTAEKTIKSKKSDSVVISDKPQNQVTSPKKELLKGLLSAQTLHGVALKNPTNIYSESSADSKTIKSYAQGILLKFKTFTSDWYECTVYIKGKATTGYINKNDVEVPTANQKTLKGIGTKSSTKVYSKASTGSKALKSYAQGSTLKYKTFTSDWYECTVYINGKATTGFINKDDVEVPTTSQKTLKGIGTKSSTKVYSKASTGSKVLKSYAQGSTLKYKTFTSDWYECTVYIKGKATTGYINKNDVEAPTTNQKALKGIGTKSPTKVYSKASTGSKVLKSYVQGSTLKYKTFTSNWYECTVYIKGKATTGYINVKDVSVPTANPTHLRGVALEKSTKVYTEASAGSKSLKSYSKGSILKYKTFISGWYECTVYIKGKATTGYIKASTVENAVTKQTTIKGSPITSVKHVYIAPSTSSKVLKSYQKGAVLKYKTFTSNWYECTVYINGKPTTGYIYAKVDPVKDLSDRVIVLDPGHGGIDPGTTGVDGLKEKVINLTYAKTVKNALESKGATVIMTRNKDENCQTGATGHEELQCRVDISKKYSADVYISIHANSSTSSSTTGIETHYSSKNDPEYPGVNKYPKESKLLAQAIQKEIVPALGGNSRGVISDNLYVTRKNTSPAALIEIGFMSNSSELNRIEESSVRNSFAKALTAALINYFNEIY